MVSNLSFQAPIIPEPRLPEPIVEWAKPVKDAVNMLNTVVSAPQPHSEMLFEDVADVYVIDTTAQDHAFHTADMEQGDMFGWDFVAGGAGTSHAITAVAAGSVGGRIEVTTGTAHGLDLLSTITQSGLVDAAYVGVFVVQQVVSTTKYEVTATFTATDTGTMNEAACLIAGAESDGVYLCIWSASASAVGANTVWDFDIHKGATALIGTRIQRKFGGAGDVGAMSGVGIFSITENDRISFMVVNQTNATDITFVNFNLVISRLQ